MIKYRILETHDTEYPYNVQQIKVIQGQEVYSGYGRFCKTMQEAEAYIAKDKAGRKGDA